MQCIATAETVGPTGVEMEALTVVQIALLTIYDMCKAADKRMVITGVQLLEKHGASREALWPEGATPYAVRWPARRDSNPRPIA